MARISTRIAIPALLILLASCGTNEHAARMKYCDELKAADFRDAREMERVAYNADLASGAHYFGGDQLVNKLRGWFIRDAALLRQKALSKHKNCMLTGAYQ